MEKITKNRNKHPLYKYRHQGRRLRGCTKGQLRQNCNTLKSRG